MDNQLASLVIVQQQHLQNQKKKIEELMDEIVMLSAFPPWFSHCSSHMEHIFFHAGVPDQPYPIDIIDWLQNDIKVEISKVNNVGQTALLFGQDKAIDMWFFKSYCRLSIHSNQVGAAHATTTYEYAFCMMEKLKPLLLSFTQQPEKVKEIAEFFRVCMKAIALKQTM